MTDNRVEVRIGGRRFGGWKSVRIETGIEQLSRAFALEVTEKFPGSTDFGFFRNGDLVQVYIGDDLVCTGWISSTPIQYDGKSVKVQIQGKSRTVDLVECCPPSAAYAAAGSKNAWVGVKGKSGTAITTTSTNPATSWKNQSVSQIIADLAKPYGVTVKDEVGIGKTLTNHTVNPGEKVFESINRLITKENLVVMDDEQGNLVITEPGSAGQAADALELGVNILAGSSAFDFSKRYSHYIAVGQHAGIDTDFGRSAAEDKGTATDSDVGRFRLLVLKDSGQSGGQMCAARANFEAAYRRGVSLKASYTIQGWRQSDGTLWRPNQFIRVEDEILKRSDLMLVTNIIFQLSASGMITTLEVSLPSAFKRDVSSQSNVVTKNAWKGVK